MEFVLFKIKVGKALGPDQITIEMIRASGSIAIIKITAILIMIYKTSIFLQDMTTSVFIAIPKKAGTTNCENHRNISLISPITKILRRIIKKLNQKY